ncbi:ATP-dependent Clp protease proteolytic subunit [Massilia sp. BJB1822]|uniref:ATP-dependent Clp protease proteolytic subunit n=1 Tax=Massilia sp. BJB1822 TaxID=2744470 RepID=UPI0015934ABA|nr:ATP-dependent Clp protease proteolytic subunit [Massilia sp. BJB1822]NVE00939.1 ATP-dependent Clp protease proteolytic subunit [Massilia sp. BJB1822]
MSEDKAKLDGQAWFTLSGDVNSDMVHRVFEAAAEMNEDGLDVAHILLQSNGGYVSDGLCLYNYLRNLPFKVVMYNGGAVASIAVILFLAGAERYASATARFMVHKSHASAPSGARPDALSVIVEGLRADDERTESILRDRIKLSEKHWETHNYTDLHLTAQDAHSVSLVHEIRDFRPPKGKRLRNI